jgi:hypothetical protein
VTYDTGRARVLAEAAIREAAQVRNHPPDLINPVVALNRAVAITERDGPEHGLASLEAIVGMERSQLWHAALADTFDGLAGPPKQPGSWKLPPHWRPPRENGGCFCLVSSM